MIIKHITNKPNLELKAKRGLHARFMANPSNKDQKASVFLLLNNVTM
jgi:hypothetical protein